MNRLCALCYVNESDGLPSWLLDVIQQHFTVVDIFEYEANKSKFTNDIVVIFSYPKKPEVCLF